MKNSTPIHRIALWLDRKYFSRNTCSACARSAPKPSVARLYSAIGQQRGAGDGQHQRAQRPPEPAERDQPPARRRPGSPSRSRPSRRRSARRRSRRRRHGEREQPVVGAAPGPERGQAGAAADGGRQRVGGGAVALGLRRNRGWARVFMAAGLSFRMARCRRSNSASVSSVRAGARQRHRDAGGGGAGAPCAGPAARSRAGVHARRASRTRRR